MKGNSSKIAELLDLHLEPSPDQQGDHRLLNWCRMKGLSLDQKGLDHKAEKENWITTPDLFTNFAPGNTPVLIMFFPNDKLLFSVRTLRSDSFPRLTTQESKPILQSLKRN